VPGNSDWDSAALTFPEFFSTGLRQFASTLLHSTLRVWASGSVLTTSPKILAFRAILKTHFVMAQRYTQFYLEVLPTELISSSGNFLREYFFGGWGREEITNYGRKNKTRTGKRIANSELVQYIDPRMTKVNG
jgi:hypothetical protein